MFDWNLLVFVWILLAGICAGFGWAVGTWVAQKLLK